MRELYNKVDKIIKEISFEQLWGGFSKVDFALYNMEEVYLPNNEVIEYDNRFIGNTSIDYNGKNIAIWYVDEPENEDPQLLSANMVHEMFHAYQKNNNESRFPNDLEGLDHPNDVKYFQLKHNESRVLVQALEESDSYGKEKLLYEFVSLRKYRFDTYGSYMPYELKIETVEGCAEYCGTQALLQICEKQYQERVERYKQIITEDMKMLFDVRRYAYFTGTLVLILLSQLKIEVSRDISENTETIFEDLLYQMENKNNIISYETISESTLKSNQIIDEVIQENYNQFMKEKDDTLQNFFNQSPVRHEGEYLICGYDPMNMNKQNNQIIHKHFVMLANPSSGDTNFIKGPIVTELEPGTVNAVIAYYSI